MLLTYVQAAPNGGKGCHFQVVGPNFPGGYASGDVANASIAAAVCFVPSMRGSGRKYAPLTVDLENGCLRNADGDVVCDVLDLIEALHAPRPEYHENQSAAVLGRVKASLVIAKEGPPKPPTPAPTAEPKITTEQVREAITNAVKAALKSLGLEA